MDCSSELTVEETVEGVPYVSLYWLHPKTTPYENVASIRRRLREGQKVRLAWVICPKGLFTYPKTYYSSTVSQSIEKPYKWSLQGETYLLSIT